MINLNQDVWEAYGANAPSSANSGIPKDPFSTEGELSWHEFRQKLTQYYGDSTTVADAFPSWKENDTVAHATRANQQSSDHQAFFRYSSEELNSLAVVIHKNIQKSHGLVSSDAEDAMQEAKRGAQDASKPRKPDFRDERRKATAEAAQFLVEYTNAADAANSNANSNNDAVLPGRARAAPDSVASAPARVATKTTPRAAVTGTRDDLVRRRVPQKPRQSQGIAPRVVSMDSAPQEPQQEKSCSCSCNWLASYFRSLKV
jgi:hypothetical protein